MPCSLLTNSIRALQHKACKRHRARRRQPPSSREKNLGNGDTMKEKNTAQLRWLQGLCDCKHCLNRSELAEQPFCLLECCVFRDSSTTEKLLMCSSGANTGLGHFRCAAPNLNTVGSCSSNNTGSATAAHTSACTNTGERKNEQGLHGNCCTNPA